LHRSASISRRDFVRAAALAWPVLPPVFRNDPYRPLPSAAPLARTGVRVRGRVHAGGRGIGGVGVSDGLAVVATDRDGRFDLVTDTGRRYVTVSVPAGYRLPTHSSGTTRCFQRIRPDARGEMAASFALDPLPGGDDAHAFLLLADIQTQDAPDMARFVRESVPDVKAAIAGLGDVPCFGVADGDIMWDELALYDDYERAVSGLGIPFVQVVGNHDLDLEEKSDGASTTTFERRFGPRYYSFDRGEVHYVVLDDVLYYGGGYLGYVDDDQLTWLANDLARVERGAPLIVFAHIPFLSSLFERRGEARPGLAQSVANRDALYRLLAPYRTRVLTGHIHESDQVTEGGVVERNHGTVCGAWWTGDICYDGTPNGYGVYEVRGSEVRWRYQSTGRDPSHQLRVYPRGADPRAPDEIVANVWAWEPGWTVVWYEDGARRGEMSRRTGLDPRSVELHQGGDLPVKRAWVDPVPTRHLFYAPVSRSAREVRVEARDLWGRSYSEVLTA
jgi:hypothetical protein